MEQLWLVGLVDEVAAPVEFEGGVRDELIRAMATAMLAVYHAGSEVHSESMEEPEDSP
jgi:hypothetical protein